MKETKNISGTFHRLFRGEMGLFGIETIVVDKGKVISQSEISPNYPTIAIAKFSKQAMNEAHNSYVEEQTVK